MLRLQLQQLETTRCEQPGKIFALQVNLQSREIRYNLKLDGFLSQTELQTEILCQELINDGILRERLVCYQ